MKKNLMELGRSMVEMLGVLAVIGVLSIIGIAGYKKAMNKMKANELMNVISALYNHTQIRAEMNSSSTAAAQYYMFLRDTGIVGDSARNSGCVANFEAPQWVGDNFNIRIGLKPNTSATYQEQTYHDVIMYYVPSCDICEELKDMTEKVGSSRYRILSGSNKAPLGTAISSGHGIRIYCRIGKDNNAQDSCYPNPQ